MTAPKERPILFSGPMVRALLDGRKTQTRRVVKKAPHEEHDWSAVIVRGEACFVQRANVGTPNETCHFMYGQEGDRPSIRCPYGAPGDRLWVKETWGLNDTIYGGDQPIPKARPEDLPTEGLVFFATESDTEIRNELRWRPSIHMPRWASRLTLEITEVRAERLHDISEADAMAEGAAPCANGVWFDSKPEFAGADARGAYYCLWEHINGAGSWAANPWVWAVSFNLLKGD
ncbi:MAG: hypothetical protein ACK4M2_01490 [Brevundimonas sp.]